MTGVAERQVNQKYPCLEQLAQQWLPCQKPSPSHLATSIQGTPLCLWGSIWIFLSLYFLLFGREYKWLWHLKQFHFISYPSIWVSGIHRLSVLHFWPIYLIFFVVGTKVKVLRANSEYAHPIWSLQAIIYTFYCSPWGCLRESFKYYLN